MYLMTEELAKRMPKLYETEDTCLDDKVAMVRYFNPVGRGEWYGIEYGPEENIMFGYVSIFKDRCMDEYGYFSLEELKSIKLPFGFEIERDLYFKPTKMSEIISKLYTNQE